MSYAATRTFLPKGPTDVFAFKTEQEARDWAKSTEEFYGIKPKQVHIEYIGKYPLKPGCYLSYEIWVEFKFKENANGSPADRQVDSTSRT